MTAALPRLAAIRRLLLVSPLLAPWGPAFALSTNPIDPSLPLNVHARATCAQGTVSYPGNHGNITLQTGDGASRGTCFGFVVQENPATLAGVYGNATGVSDLATGTLRAVAIGRSYSDAENGLRAGASNEVNLYDTLTVQGNWTGVRVIELRLTVRGSLTSNAATPNWQSSDISSRLFTLSEAGTLLGNAGLFIDQGNNGIPFITSTTATGATLETNAIDDVFDPDDVEFSMTYLFPATTSNRTFSFLGRISLSAATPPTTVRTTRMPRRRTSTPTAAAMPASAETRTGTEWSTCST